MPKMRSCFLLASQDIERIVKTRLIERISLTPGEDGYGILADFMQSQVKGYRASIERNLKGRIGKHGSADEYTGALIAHYSEAMPIWVFLEVVSFGTLLAFYLFCASRWDDRSMRMRHSDADGGEGGEELLLPRHMPHKRSGRGQVLRVRDAAPGDRVACGARLQERQVEARQDGQPTGLSSS